MKKHTLETALIQIDRLQSSRGHFKRATEKLRVENSFLTESLERSRLKEHEALEKTKALEKSLKNIAEVQALEKQSFENLQRQLKQVRESGGMVASDNEQLKRYLDSSRHTIDSQSSFISRYEFEINDLKNEVAYRDFEIGELKNGVKFWRSVGMFAMCASVLTIIGHILFS